MNRNIPINNCITNEPIFAVVEGSIVCAFSISAKSIIEIKEELISVPEIMMTGNTKRNRAFPSVRK
jgi:hypothetical protein